MPGLVGGGDLAAQGDQAFASSGSVRAEAKAWFSGRLVESERTAVLG